MAEVNVSLFRSDHPHLARTLAGRLRQEADSLAIEIAKGWCQDWTDYKSRCARLTCLLEIIERCEDMNKEMFK